MLWAEGSYRRGEEGYGRTGLCCGLRVEYGEGERESDVGVKRRREAKNLRSDGK